MKKRQSFFRPSTLIFQESGHTLRISDRHYRCDLDCRGRCDQKEPQIKTDTLEKAFTRLANNFQTDTDTVKAMREDVLKTYLSKIILDSFEEKDKAQNEIDRTLLAMQKDTKAGLELEKEDVPDIENAFVRLQELDYPTLLFGYLVGFLAGLSPNCAPIERARNFALISTTIYLSNKGKISAIEFERWGWYMINFVAKYQPQYLDQLSKVEILNSTDELLDLELSDALNYFTKDNFDEALHNHSANEIYPVFKMMKDLIKVLASGDAEATQKGVVEMMSQMTQLPQVEFSARITPLIK